MMHRLGLLILGWAMLVGLGACVSVQVTPYDLGVALQDRGELSAALEHYKEELAVHPHHLRARFNLADIAEAEGDLVQAQHLLLRAVEAEPDRAYPYSFLGRYLQQQGQLDAAQTAYERALAIEDDVLTHYRLGALWLQRGQTLEAKQQFTRAVELAPNDVKSLYQLALLALQS